MRRTSSLAVAILGLLPSLAMADGISYPDFSSTTGVTLLNNATTSGTALQLTSNAYLGFTAGSGGDAEFADIFNFDEAPTATPEPASLLLLGCSLVAIGLRRKFMSR